MASSDRELIELFLPRGRIARGARVASLLGALSERSVTHLAVVRRHHDFPVWRVRATAAGSRAPLRFLINRELSIELSPYIESVVGGPNGGIGGKVAIPDAVSSAIGELELECHLLVEPSVKYALVVGKSSAAASMHNQSFEIADPTIVRDREVLGLALSAFDLSREVSYARVRFAAENTLVSLLADETLDEAGWIERVGKVASRLLRGARTCFVVSTHSEELRHSIATLPGPGSPAAAQQQDIGTMTMASGGVIISDISAGADKVVENILVALGVRRWGSLLILPVASPEGEVLGHLVSHRGVRYGFESLDLLALSTLAETARAGLVLRRTRALAHTEGTLHRELARALDQAVEAMAITDFNGHHVYANLSFLQMHGCSEQELRTLKTIDFYPPDIDPGYISFLDQRAALGENVSVEEDRVRRDGTRFTALILIGPLRDDAGRTVGLIKTILDTSSRARAMEILRSQASQDPLTGLENRRALIGALEGLLLEQEEGFVGVLYLDLDRFKEINDTFGHHVGDDFLKSVANRLRSLVREVDIVGRLGGDEFLVLLPYLPSRSLGLAIISRVARRLTEQPIVITGQRIRVGASYGAAFSERGQMSADELVAKADEAMYRMKEASKVGYLGGVPVDHSMGSAIGDRELGDHLAMAIRSPEASGLSIRYNLIYDLVNLRMNGIQAYAHWQNEEVGSVSWSRIKWIASMTRQVSDLTRWMLQVMREDGTRWVREESSLVAPLAQGLEIPAQVLFDRPMLRKLVNAAMMNRTPGSRFFFDINESAINGRDRRSITASLEFLRDRGFSVAITEFGRHAPIGRLIRTSAAAYFVGPDDERGWAEEPKILGAASLFTSGSQTFLVASDVTSSSDIAIVRRYAQFALGPLVGQGLDAANVLELLRQSAGLGSE